MKLKLTVKLYNTKIKRTVANPNDIALVDDWTQIPYYPMKREKIEIDLQPSLPPPPNPPPTPKPQPLPLPLQIKQNKRQLLFTNGKLLLK